MSGREPPGGSGQQVRKHCLTIGTTQYGLRIDTEVEHVDSNEPEQEPKTSNSTRYHVRSQDKQASVWSYRAGSVGGEREVMRRRQGPLILDPFPHVVVDMSRCVDESHWISLMETAKDNYDAAFIIIINLGPGPVVVGPGIPDIGTTHRLAKETALSAARIGMGGLAIYYRNDLFETKKTVVEVHRDFETGFPSVHEVVVRITTKPQVLIRTAMSHKD